VKENPVTADPIASRLEVAHRIAAAYEPGHRPDIFAVAGSTGAGRADRWSDLEIDCYWSEVPTDGERLAPITRLGGELENLWAYDPDDHEWSEDYRLDGLGVTVSNFLGSTVEDMIDELVDAGEIDDVEQYRFAAISCSRALIGGDTLARWKSRIAVMPDPVAVSLVTESLDPDAIPGWHSRSALLERGDEIALRATIAAVAESVVPAVLAINRVYRPHRFAKWQRALLSECAHLPQGLETELRAMWDADLQASLDHAERLLDATVDCAETVLGTQLPEVREDLARQRTVWEG
jgi:hypothetical protein